MLRVYNSLTRQKEDFHPLQGKEVKIYTCGLTVQDYCHIGHARMDIIWDMIKRFLRYSGYQVYHVQNFTDINEKIAAKAQAAGIDPLEWADRFINEYFTDMKALKVEGADRYVRVTENIPIIIDMIQELIDGGFAYQAQGNVYFRVAACPDYGKLSGRRVEEMQAGARLAVEETKENPADFALWTVAQPGEPTWDSPWGPGTPGWHIECSAMSTEYLGKSYDMHGGGVDIIFPHHENELAQAECATGVEPYVKYWLHHGMVTLPGGEKMSKSLNNFFRVRDVLDKVKPEVLRFFILSTHYRSPIAFSEELVEQSGTALQRIANTVGSVMNSISSQAQAEGEESQLADLISSARQRFDQAMADDFNSAEAIGVIFDLCRQINTHLSSSRSLSHAIGDQLLDAFRVWAAILGITDTLFPKAEGIDAEIESLIAERQQARAKKDWGTADRIRKQLDELGIVLMDTPQGVTWKRK
ncbi:MAG: cysteine--tRNA ligase [Bacillota bacterium]